MKIPRLHHALFPALLAAIASSVTAQAFYGTGFETPNYVVGQPLDGMDEWRAAASPLAGEIVSGRAYASTGRRALMCWGGDPNLESVEIAPGVFLLDGAWYRDAGDFPYPHDLLARVQADVRLEGPLTSVDWLSANLIARNGSWNSAQLWLSSDGNVYCNSWGTDPVTGPFENVYQFPTPIPHGMYARLAIIYDYTTHLAAFEVNGVIVGVLPYGGPGEGGFNGVFLEFAAFDDPLAIDPSLYTGYWDNVGHLAIPRG